MKKFIAITVLGLFAITACNQPGTTSNNTPKGDSNNHPTALSLGQEDTAFIPIDTANKMIQSYLTSIGGTGGVDTSLHSLIVDANALRKYLTTDSGMSISHLKIMFAHKLDYINSGHAGQPCGYGINGLTAVMAGYNNAGNYVFYPVDLVMDQMRPCPHECPVNGSASNDLLVR